MGLLSWLVAAGRDTIAEIVIVWLIEAAIGFAAGITLFWEPLRF